MPSERLQRQIDRLLDEAEEAIARLDWEVVRARARAVLAIDSDNGEGRAFLGVAERALKTEIDVVKTPREPPGNIRLYWSGAATDLLVSATA